MTFLLRTDPKHCADLQQVLQAWIADPIVTLTPCLDESVPRLTESDSTTISTEERNLSVPK